MDFITNFISHAGYLGIVVLMAIESAAIPLPSEIIMPFSGFLVSMGNMTLLGISLAGAIGSGIGSVVLYYIGYFGGRPLIEKYGKYILLSKKDLDYSEKFFHKYGNLSTFIGRMLPIVRTFISLPAGIYKVEVKMFTFYSIVGSFFWSYLLGYIGFKLGQNWDSLHGYFRQLDLFIGILLLIGVGWYIFRHLKHYREYKKN